MNIPNYQSDVEQCARDYPLEFQVCHRVGHPQRYDFIKILAKRLHAKDKNVALNGKRGGTEISMDALNILCDAADSEGRTPDGQPCVVVDVVSSAGALPPYTNTNREPRPMWGVYNTLIEGSGANIDPDTASPSTPGQTNPPLLPYESLGGDKTGQAISRAMAFDYERATRGAGKLDKGCGAWMFRSCYVLMARQEGIDTAEKAIAKYRPEWCGQLGVEMIPIPSDY